MINEKLVCVRVCGFVLSAHVSRLLMQFASYMCSFSLDIEVDEPEAGQFG